MHLSNHFNINLNSHKNNKNALALIVGVSNYENTKARALYADNDAMERASAARTKRMDLNKDLIESMEGKTGEVILNHK